ncbi:hypothetical protein B0H21DRAFT_745643 [Amylocystis lapponica]|nr:hypothetical protein B0H21DRAFT_745643 [Amylocystis lapponica]
MFDGLLVCSSCWLRLRSARFLYLTRHHHDCRDQTSSTNLFPMAIRTIRISNGRGDVDFECQSLTGMLTDSPNRCFGNT